ncbi:MAG: DUF3592 domain-containing protein, partial [Burkholderiales bacterium]|nr:DUF3592 domain-containing protein [Burkholderiales bacterium]
MLHVLIFLLSAIGAMLLMNAVEWRLRARRVVATLVGVRRGASASEGPWLYDPVYEYADASGRTVQVQSNSRRSDLQGLRTGRQVVLMLDWDDPGQGRECGDFGREAIGAVFTLAGAWQLSLEYRDWSPYQLASVLVGLALLYVPLRRLVRPRSPPSAPGGSGTEAAAAAAPPLLRPEDLGRKGTLRPRSRSAGWGLVLGCLLGIAFACAGAYLARDAWRFETEGLRAEGVVVGLDAKSTSKGGTVYSAVVSFVRRGDRQPSRVEDGMGTDPPLYRVGDRVDVLYLDDGTGRATIDHGLGVWLPPLLFVGLGLALACGSVWAWRRSRSGAGPDRESGPAGPGPAAAERGAWPMPSARHDA